MDSRKLRSAAAEAAAKGKHKKALEKYLELERLEPRDGGWARRVGEMYRQLGRVDDGIAAFQRAAEKYADSGLVTKASAVCKTILRMRPGDEDARARLEKLVPAGARPSVAPGEFSRPQSVSDLSREELAAEQPSPARAAPETESQPRVRAGGSVPPPVPPRGVPPTEPPVAPPAPAAGDDDLEDIEELDAEFLEDVEEIEEEPAAAAPAAAEAPATAPPPAEELEIEAELGDDLAAVAGLEIEADPGDDLAAAGLELEVDSEPGAGPPTAPNFEDASGAAAPAAAPEQAGGAGPAAEPELDREAILRDVVVSNPLFAGFEDGEARALAERFEVARVAPGETLALAGELADRLLVVARGELALSREGGEATAGPGAVLGAASLLSRTPEPATARALTSCVVLSLPEPTFREVIMTHPMLLAQLAES